VSSTGNGAAGLIVIQRDLSLLLSHKCLCHLQSTALRHTYLFIYYLKFVVIQHTSDPPY
jgi:hypothetical protein